MKLKKKSYSTIIKLILSYKGWLAMAMVCMVVVAASTSGFAYLIKHVMDDIFGQKNVRMLHLLPVVIMVIYFLKNIATFGQAYFMNYVGNRIVRDLQNILFAHMMTLSISYFYKEKTGVLMSRVTYDVSIIKNMVSTSVTGALKDTFTIIGLIAVIFFMDWKMAIIAFLVLPLAGYPISRFSRRVRKVSTGFQESMANISSFLHETFSGNKIVKAFGMEDYEVRRFEDKTLQQFKIQMKSVKAKALSSPVMDLLGGIAVSVCILYGGYRVVIYQNLTSGEFFSFIAAAIMLYDPLRRLTQVNNAVQEGLAATERVFAVIDLSSDIVDAPDAVDLKPGAHKVVFDRVAFKYEEDLVLNNISLNVNPGEVIALVGMSGGGKTTLVNLIPRFYDVTAGSIRIDGKDIRQYTISSLRSQIAIVTQEPILFNESIRNNIAYGNRDASDQEIEAAARAAFAYDFIQGFPHQFDTNIGELGSRLSGGEKQRICVARALLKNAPILILDEATSALDSQAEALVQKALENLMKGRTTFVIAHRLSTIIHADRIVMLAGGKIVEQGSHDELMAQKGAYYKLHQIQFQKSPAGQSRTA